MLAEGGFKTNMETSKLKIEPSESESCKALFGRHWPAFVLQPRTFRSKKLKRTAKSKPATCADIPDMRSGVAHTTS